MNISLNLIVPIGTNNRSNVIFLVRHTVLSAYLGVKIGFSFSVIRLLGLIIFHIFPRVFLL